MIQEFESSIGKLDHLLGAHCIIVPSQVVQSFGGFNNNRFWVTINQKLRFQGGLVALGEGSAYITLNQKRMKEMQLQYGDSISVQLEVDNSEFGMEVPDELIELLAQDQEAKYRFDLLTKAKQRYIIYHVAGVKSSEKRIERALLLLTNLKTLPIGKESFREMLGK